MGCLDGIVSPDKTISSRGGLYANLLPGVPLAMLDDLTKDEQADYLEFWSDIYARAKTNFVNDIQTKLAGRFHIDQKLVSRETSQFDTTNVTASNPGIQIYFYFSKYSRLYIASIQVYSNTIVNNATFTIRDTDINGAIQGTITANLVVGLNTIYVDQEYEVATQLFITYDSSVLSLRQTENRYFNNYSYYAFNKLECSYPCFFSGYRYGAEGGEYSCSVFQVNGGGINAVFNIVCSIEKFICHNINLFKVAFWWWIGVELMTERIMSDKFNRWTVLTTERAKELLEMYQANYDKHLKASTDNLKTTEDSVCFECKSTVSAKPMLP
jgi:hypothetical protein